MIKSKLIWATMLLALPAWAQPKPIEIHHRLLAVAPFAKNVALTLDACSGKFDVDLIDFLIRNRVPATIFATKKWLDHNPLGVALIKAHLDLFDVENHGENHIPAVIGAGRKVYGIPGEPDVIHLRREVTEGARAITKMIGVPPHWYRGATAEYDRQALDEIKTMGYKVAGFSLNAASSLLQLLKNGFVFIRLDNVDLQEITNQPARQTPSKPRIAAGDKHEKVKLAPSL